MGCFRIDQNGLDAKVWLGTPNQLKEYRIALIHYFQGSLIDAAAEIRVR
jgi:hypothetical protein